MKKTKIIVPALGILLLSTAASVTGTVAWFTTNNTVTASSMTVKAVVSGNLFIKEGMNVAYANINAISADITMSALALQPADINFADGSADVRIPLTYAESKAPTIDSAGQAATWSSVGLITATTKADTTVNYVATAFVSLANKQTNPSTFGLKPTCTVTVNDAQYNLAGALRAGMIIQPDGGTAAYYESGNASVSGTTVTLAWTSFPTALEDNVAHRAALMLWYEGEDEDCFVNNAQNLANCVAEWSLTSAVA